MKTPVVNVEIEGLRLFKRGKVRDIYDLEDKLLIISTDRISCFDVVLPDPIPYKGIILNQISLFWFDFVKDICENHIISSSIQDFPAEARKYGDILEGRSVLVKKAKIIPIECVVRGYLAGSGWKEYQKSGSICGIKLPEGLKYADKLPEPIFTPATKETEGHDINITFEEMKRRVGKEVSEKIREKSIEIYKKASEYAEKKGIIISDTKFEFGFVDGKLILIDEILTPDSSRFWFVEKYSPGKPQFSMDKQFVRDYLETINWNKTPPAPNLPQNIIEETSKRYREIYKILTGREI
ncbi:MAG TPA: phosphoribosylaminoimidazolesuccinocarboxamide synthase [Firmicutes bacterium]|nr:phosphoribosylaminoimidazolesuccinocarboxamide synthase [Bacillota bacterium]